MIPMIPTTSADGDGLYNKAMASVPEGMKVKKSNMKQAGLGVFATEAQKGPDFEKNGSTFGPYKGEEFRGDISKVGLETSYMWEVRIYFI